MDKLKFMGKGVETLGHLGARQVVLFLHGTGDNSKGIKDWVSSLIKIPSDFLFIFPSAPARPYSMFGGDPCTVWHDRWSLDIDAKEDLEGIETMSKEVDKIISELTALGVDRSNLTLGGFSQGGHLTLHCVLGQGIQIGRYFALSAFLARSSEVYRRLDGGGSDGRKQPPLFLSTGDVDTMVHHSWVEETRNKLKNQGISITFSLRPHRGHELDSVQLKELLEWIRETGSHE